MMDHLDVSLSRFSKHHKLSNRENQELFEDVEMSETLSLCHLANRSRVLALEVLLVSEALLCRQLHLSPWQVLYQTSKARTRNRSDLHIP